MPAARPALPSGGGGRDHGRSAWTLTSPEGLVVVVTFKLAALKGFCFESNLLFTFHTYLEVWRQSRETSKIKIPFTWALCKGR